MVKYEDEIYTKFREMSVDERTTSLSYLCQMLLPTQTHCPLVIKDLVIFIRNENVLFDLKNTIEKQILDARGRELESNLKRTII